MICFLGKGQPFERGETCSDRSIDHEATHLYRWGQFTSYELRNSLEFQTGKAAEIHASEFPVAECWAPLYNFRIIPIAFQVDNSKFYFGVDKMRIKRSDFDQLISNLQDMIDMSEDDILEQFARILLVDKTKVYNSINKVVFIGISVKNKDLEIYVRPDDIRSIREALE